jgi:hypothetical protein
MPEADGGWRCQALDGHVLAIAQPQKRFEPIGIKQKTGEIIYDWLNLQLICADDENINIGYSS